MRPTRVTLLAGLAFAGLLCRPAVAGDKVTPRIEGTWEVTSTSEDGFEYHERVTFSAGRTATDGTVVTTSELDFTPPFPCLTSQGSWVRTAGRHFASTVKAFCFDGAPGTLAARLKLHDEIQLSDDGNEFTGTEDVEFATLDGSETFTATSSIHGVRLNATGN